MHRSKPPQKACLFHPARGGGRGSLVWQTTLENLILHHLPCVCMHFPLNIMIPLTAFEHTFRNLSGWEGTAPPNPQRQGMAQPGAHLCSANLTVQNRAPFYLACTPWGTVLLCINHPTPRSQATKDHRCGSEPTKTIQMSRCQWFTLPCFALSVETSRNALS